MSIGILRFSGKVHKYHDEFFVVPADEWKLWMEHVYNHVASDNKDLTLKELFQTFPDARQDVISVLDDDMNVDEMQDWDKYQIWSTLILEPFLVYEQEHEHKVFHNIQKLFVDRFDP